MRAKSKKSRVVDGIVSAVVLAPAARERVALAVEPHVIRPRRRSKCPLCRKRDATTEVTLGVVIVQVCDVCSDPVYKGIGFLAALTRLL